MTAAAGGSGRALAVAGGGCAGRSRVTARTGAAAGPARTVLAAVLPVLLAVPLLPGRVGTRPSALVRTPEPRASATRQPRPRHPAAAGPGRPGPGAVACRTGGRILPVGAAAGHPPRDPSGG